MFAKRILSSTIKFKKMLLTCCQVNSWRGNIKRLRNESLVPHQSKAFRRSSLSPSHMHILVGLEDLGDLEIPAPPGAGISKC